MSFTEMCSDGIYCLSFFVFDRILLVQSHPYSYHRKICSVSATTEFTILDVSFWLDDDGTRTHPDGSWWWFWQFRCFLSFPFPPSLSKLIYLLYLNIYFQTKTRRCGTTMAAKSFPSTCSTLTCCPRNAKSSEMSWAISSGARPIPLLALLFWVREYGYKELQLWKKQQGESIRIPWRSLVSRRSRGANITHAHVNPGKWLQTLLKHIHNKNTANNS